MTTKSAQQPSSSLGAEQSAPVFSPPRIRPRDAAIAFGIYMLSTASMGWAVWAIWGAVREALR